MRYFQVVNGRVNRIRPWPKTLTKKRALQLSIRKWKTVVEDFSVLTADEDGGWMTCALCHLYIENDRCSGCPVAEHVNDEGCNSTPYVNRHENNPQEELDFLKEVYLNKYGEEYP
ncbi:hypothetical protein LCGC14_0660040 [marine sediment metagenome]|uniref:Uncharacterized protein n=1 Tax=marine sediment metagenome TaxID=412755 RepID=A0A0F9TF49_9ZZZZ